MTDGLLCPTHSLYQVRCKGVLSWGCRVRVVGDTSPAPGLKEMLGGGGGSERSCESGGRERFGRGHAQVTWNPHTLAHL